MHKIVSALAAEDSSNKYGLQACPERSVDPIRRLAQLKKLLRKLNNKIEVVVEPSCLSLDPSWQSDRAYSVMFFFFEMSEYEGYEKNIDLGHLNTLFEKGAKINAIDKLGQTILHDCARVHKVTTAKYFIRSGVDVNTQDIYGRTALHIAAKRDYVEMVRMLIDAGAKLELVTNGACHTALHCAAMGDAPNAITALCKGNANKEISDYRGRTPLLIAAEYERRAASSKLIDLGASARVVDFTGLHALSVLISKMPQIALKALDQCVDLDEKNRELKVWLNYMEPDLLVPKDARYGFSLLDEVTNCSDSTLVQHPAIDRLIQTKWKQFGHRAVIKDIGLYVIYLLSWSLLMILTPLDPSDETTEPRGTRRLITEATAYILYVGFVIEEINEARLGHIIQQKWKSMRMGQVQSDLKILQPISVLERQYLNNEMQKALGTKSVYFQDAWNIYDWVSYSLQFVGIIVYLYCEIKDPQIDKKDKHLLQSYVPIFRIRSQLMSLAVLLSWFKVFKYVRVFKSLGPFVVIITHSIGDIAKIAFVYLVLYVPMVCVFYQFYGNRGITGYETVEDVMFTVFRMIVVDDYNYKGILGDHVSSKTNVTYNSSRDIPIDKWWSRSLVAYWILTSSVILLNLLIALMSDTFQRVYENAVGVAALEKAETICGIECKLNKKSRDRYLKDLNDNYSPMGELHEQTDDPDADQCVKAIEELEKKMSEIETSLGENIEELKDELENMHEKQNKILEKIDAKLTEINLRNR